MLGAIGVTVQKGTIQGDEDFASCCKQAVGHDFKKDGRVFRFLLSKDKRKLVRASGGRRVFCPSHSSSASFAVTWTCAGSVFHP